MGNKKWRNGRERQPPHCRPFSIESRASLERNLARRESRERFPGEKRGKKKFKMFEEGVATPAYPPLAARCRQGLYSCGMLGNACWVRATHLSTHVRPFVRHDTDTKGRVGCVGTREEAFRSGTDADAWPGSEQTGPAGFFGREGADGSDAVDVCLPL